MKLVIVFFLFFVFSILQYRLFGVKCLRRFFWIFSATPILIHYLTVFATAWADFMVKLFAYHLLTAAIAKGQDFIDRVFHFHFPFLSFLTSYIDIIPKILELSTPLLDFFEIFCVCKYHAKTLTPLMGDAAPAAPPQWGVFPLACVGLIGGWFRMYRCTLVEPPLSQLGCTFSDNAPQ
jgi:hypothetical protein